MDCVIGDFRQDRVDRHDQKIDAKDGSNAGKRRRQPRKRMPAEAQKRGSSERNQDQVCGIGSNAPQHPRGDENPGDRLARCDLDDFPYEGGHQARLLGEPDADRDYEDDSDWAEIREVPYHRSQHEADAVAAQQTVDGGGRMIDLVGLWVDHLVIDRCPEQVKQMREDNYQPRQDEENHRGMWDLVPDPLNAVEELLQKCFWCFDRFRYGHNTLLLTHICKSFSANYNRKSSCFASGCICSKPTAEFLLEVSIGLARVRAGRPQALGDERNGTLAFGRG